MERELVVGGVYRHFKYEMDAQYNMMRHMYLVVATATHTETKEELVIYKNLISDKVFARPKDMFLSEVDHEKYPDIKQKYRLEKI